MPLFRYIARLIDSNDPASSEVAMTILACSCLCFLLTFMGIASIWIQKSLMAEIGAVLTALTSLVGWNIHKKTIADTKLAEINSRSTDDK